MCAETSVSQFFRAHKIDYGFIHFIILSRHCVEVSVLANIKSAKKRVLIAQVRNERNKAIKSGVKTAVKKVEAAVAAADKETAQKELLNATSLIDKAQKKGIFHKNTASNKVSRLAKLVNTLQ